MAAEDMQNTEPRESEFEPNRRGGLSVPWLAWSFIFVFVYFLSIGPVARIYENYNMPGSHPRTEKVLQAIYAPIIIPAGIYPPAGQLLVWYLKIWRVPRN